MQSKTTLQGALPAAMSSLALVLVCSVASLAVGAVLPWLPWARRHGLGPMRTFALAAAICVVLTHLLPEAAESLGGWTLLLVLIGFGIPSFFERLGTLARGVISSRAPLSNHSLAVHVSLIGLTAHQLTEGLVLGAYRGNDPVAVALALGAHTIPLTALLMMSIDEPVSFFGVTIRTGILAAGSIIGIVMGAYAMGPADHDSTAWMTALAAGLVLHLVGHDLTANPPVGWIGKSIDLGALILGIFVTIVGVRAHRQMTGEESVMAKQFVHSLADLAMATAPVLLAGLALGAGLRTLGGAWQKKQSTIVTGSAHFEPIHGTLLGALLPVCACGVLPLAQSLRKRGAGVVTVIALLLATPALGIDTLVLTGQFLGWPLALSRLLLAIVLPIVAALAVGLVRKNTINELNPDDSLRVAPVHAEKGMLHAISYYKRYWSTFDEMMLHTAPWVLVGLISTAYLDVLVPADYLLPLRKNNLDILLVAVLATPGYLCASAAAPLAAILLAKGLSPGAILVGLLIGPVLSFSTIRFVRTFFGKRIVALLLGVMIVVVLASGVLANHVIPVSPWAFPEQANHPHSIWSMLVAVLLTTLVFRALWVSGARAWVAALLGVHVHTEEEPSLLG